MKSISVQQSNPTTNPQNMNVASTAKAAKAKISITTLQFAK